MSCMHPASHTLRLLTIAMSGALGIAYPLTSSGHTKVRAPQSGKVIHITGVRKTGHKADAPLKAAYTEHAIGAQAIRHASPAQNAQTILARKPSINAFSTGPNGVRSTITFRSFTSGQFTETFDGIPLNDMFNGAATNSASMRNAIPLTLADTASIQIYNGINNPAVNGYNSLGGTINYKPLQPARRLGGAVEVGYGSFDTANWGAVINTGSLDGFRSVFSFHRQTSHGWVKNSADQNNNFYYAGVMPYDGGRSQISTYLIVNHNTGYTPHSVPEPLVNQYGITYDWPLNYEQTNNKDTEITAIVDAKSLVSRSVITDSKVFYQSDNYQRTSYSNPAFGQSASQPYYLPNQGTSYDFWSSYPTPPTYDPAAIFGSVLTGTDYQLYQDTSSDLGYSPSVTILAPHNIVTVGGNVTYGLLRSTEYWYGSAPVPQIPGYNNAWYEHDERLLASAYAQDDVSLFDDAVHITPGVKVLDAYTISSDAIGIYYPIGGTVANNQHFVSPTLGLNYAPLPGFSVYASWGRNIKFPNIGAYYSNIAETNAAGQYVVVPVSIKPEYVTDYELGTRYRHAGFLGSIDAYREYFSNTFVNVTNPTTALTTTTNGGRSRYQGVELTLEQHFGRFFVGRWMGYANYSYNQAVFTSSFNSSAVGQVSAGQPLANVPKNMVNVGLGWRLGDVDARIGAKYVGPQYVNQQFAGVPGGLKIPGYTVTNIGLFDTIPLHEVDVKSVKLALNIDNAFNHHYVVAATSNTDYYGNPYLSVFEGMPFSVYGSATLTF
ncbi:TonB-dependent receptor [Acidiferrobacter sp.]|uniref:TonB-dependent receptor n=2 Tax=Acidiferrobacter sp. TaxID=1872107 RepID=UPI002629AAE5|nr:TonB-dependent receptor [Acidiferrobacter sp.]